MYHNRNGRNYDRYQDFLPFRRCILSHISFDVVLGNLTVTPMDTSLVTICVVKPAMDKLISISFVFPPNLFELAMLDPKIWMSKEVISPPTSILVIFLAGMWKIFGMADEV